MHEVAAAHSPRTHAAVAVVIVIAVTLIAAPLLVWATLHLTRMDTAVVTVGRARVSALVADTPIRRSRGLQGRDGLAEGEGMLFVFDPPQDAAFELKTVTFPLDVVFVGDDGSVTATSPLDAMRSRAESPGDVAYVLEVPLGWCARHGVTVGSRVSVDAP